MSRPIDSAVKGPYLIIEAANKNDRFRLLEDDVPNPDLDIPIHPLFQRIKFQNSGDNVYKNLQQALRLASMFVHDDSVLEWFVRPLLGRPLIDPASEKTYLSDPLANKTDVEKKTLIEHVRQGLLCLAHCNDIRFADSPGRECYARTLSLPVKVNSCSLCNVEWGSKYSTRIEIRMQHWRFYQNQYINASQCEQIRQDFSFAVTLIHEITHALSIMRRGSLKEEFICLNHPAAEFGYAWENFMFGTIINPFDRCSDGINFLMAKRWVENNLYTNSAFRDWAAVPVSYIAQWFQVSTWRRIAEDGPRAVIPPQVELRCHAERFGYTVLTTQPETLSDIRQAQRETRDYYVSLSGKKCYPTGALIFIRAKRQRVDANELQQWRFPIPCQLHSHSCHSNLKTMTPRITGPSEMAVNPDLITTKSQAISVHEHPHATQSANSARYNSNQLAGGRKRPASTLDCELDRDTQNPPKRVR